MDRCLDIHPAGLIASTADRPNPPNLIEEPGHSESCQGAEKMKNRASFLVESRDEQEERADRRIYPCVAREREKDTWKHSGSVLPILTETSPAREETRTKRANFFFFSGIQKCVFVYPTAYHAGIARGTVKTREKRHASAWINRFNDGIESSS